MRPGRRKSRPRSKQRPDHEDASEGMVVAVDRGRFTVELGAEQGGREVFAVKARELGRKGLTIGDAVALVGDLAGGPDALARIIRRHPRRTVLRRTADDTDPVERVVVANADQLAIVVSLANPEPQPRLIDRALVAAYDGGLTPLLVLTKRDLADPDPLLASYRPLGVTSVAVRRDGDLDELLGYLAGKVTALLGTSGVGKSTLVNALVPDADRSTGRVNVVTGRGRIRPPRQWPCACRRVAGWSTPLASARSVLPTSTSAGSCMPSPTSRPVSVRARADARTTWTTVPWTRTWPPVMPRGRGWSRCADCCPAARLTWAARSPGQGATSHPDCSSRSACRPRPPSIRSVRPARPGRLPLLPPRQQPPTPRGTTRG